MRPSWLLVVLVACGNKPAPSAVAPVAPDLGERGSGSPQGTGSIGPTASWLG